ncbi:hypothetical protein WG936_08245 [Corynebacterium sp. H127]|uniref:hypothetical protein n=1 Tax=Corynebacterium sp. H127 TaxID=3133418 RepID=UPI0030A692F2
MATTITLEGRLADITSAPIHSLTSCTVKAPAYAPGPGVEITTSAPQPVNVAEDGAVTVNVVEGVGWLYLAGPGWTESIRFVAAAGMSTLWEAVVNALPINVEAKRLLTNLGNSYAGFRASLLLMSQQYENMLNASTQAGMDKFKRIVSEAIFDFQSDVAHVDEVAASIDAAFADSIPPYLQPDSPTGLNATYVRVDERPVNLANRIPRDYTPDQDATLWIADALKESGNVEWPEGLQATLDDPTGIVVKQGQSLRGSAGAKAIISHGAAGFKNFGTIDGITVDRPAQGQTMHAAGIWIMPGSNGAQAVGCRFTGGHTAAVVTGGSSDTQEGVAVDATLANNVAEDMTGVGSYGYRIDSSEAVTLLNCISQGANLDNLKFRVKTRDPRVIGGRYSGSRGGDGLDAFAGVDGGFVGGGVIFDNNGLNNIVIKTDMLSEMYPEVPRDSAGRVTDPVAARAAVADQISKFGLPRQTIVQGVICRGAKAGGISFHRSDGNDSDFANGWPMPWLADLLVRDIMIDSPAGIGLGINVCNALVSGVQILNAANTGLYVYENARQIRLDQIAIRGAGSPTLTGLPQDGVVLAGRDVWLSQVLVDGAQHGAWASEADATAAKKITRLGFNATTAAAAATHHYSQCAATRLISAGLSTTARDYSTHLDGVYESAAGTSLGGTWLRGGAGQLQVSSTGATGWQRVGNQMVTGAQLSSATHAVNTQGKAPGAMAWVLETQRLYVTDGAAPTSTWYQVGGADKIIPA